jgi:hypothetical protein
MNNVEAITVLKGVRAHLETVLNSIARKRSWRASEKAMTAASFRREIEAIDYAIKTLESLLPSAKTLGELDKSEPGWDHFDKTPIDPTALAAGRPLVTKTRR